MLSEFDEPDFLSIRCPACQAPLRIRSRLAGTMGTCPKCRSQISIPVRPEIEFELPQPVGESEAVTVEGGYRIAGGIDFQADDHPEPLPVELRPAAPEGGFLDQMGRVREQPLEAPPKYAFFSGVFEFPWYSEVWLRWLFLVLGGCAATMIPWLAIMFLEGTSGYAAVGLAFFALPQIWISIWTGSYAASCGMQIFDDTAAGNDHVTGWPEPNWREWVWPLMYLTYVAAMVLGLAYGLGLILGGGSLTMQRTLAITEFLLFPICLLSVLEANSPLVLISPAVLGTLLRKFTSWLQFYMSTAALLVVWVGTIWAAYRTHALLVILVNGLSYATLTLIWFRLLGRLAWSISHRRSRRRT